MCVNNSYSSVQRGSTEQCRPTIHARAVFARKRIEVGELFDLSDDDGVCAMCTGIEVHATECPNGPHDDEYGWSVYDRDVRVMFYDWSVEDRENRVMFYV